MVADPVRYSPGVEDVTPGEVETIGPLDETFDTILARVADHSGHAVRTVHAKAHGILEGTTTVLLGLAPEPAQGLFAKPGEHGIDMRLSTDAGDVLPDAIRETRRSEMPGIEGKWEFRVQLWRARDAPYRHSAAFRERFNRCPVREPAGKP